MKISMLNLQAFIASIFTLSLFTYALPQYRFIYNISLETLAIALLMAALSLLQIVKRGSVNPNILFFILVIILINIFSQLFSPFEPTHQFYKILAASFIFFFITHYFISINPMIEKVLVSHVILSLILVIYGTYIYITGDMVGTQTEDEGWKTIGRYWGFRYTVSTRNDDIFYIIPSFILLVSWYIFNKGVYKKTLLFILSFLYFVIIALSFSRGHILSSILTLFSISYVYLKYIKIYNNHINHNIFIVLFKIFFSMFIGILILFVVLAVIELWIPEFQLLTSFVVKMISIVDPSYQYEFSGMSSSNQARLNIYEIALKLIFTYPFGVGAENFVFASISDGYGKYWGENTYLEYFVDFGVFGGIVVTTFIFYPVVILYSRVKKMKDFRNLFFFSLALYISLASLFNVLIGNLYFYLLYSMIYSHIIYSKNFFKTRELST